MININYKNSAPLLISHRGNLSGVDEKLENHPSHILDVLKMGLYVEVDIWCCENIFYLGHDEPQYKINESFFMNEKIIWHCKNRESLQKMYNSNLHYFWHHGDEYTITSKGYIWCHANSIAVAGSIVVLNDSNFNNAIHSGLCSDNILQYV